MQLISAFYAVKKSLKPPPGLNLSQCENTGKGMHRAATGETERRIDYSEDYRQPVVKTLLDLFRDDP